MKKQSNEKASFYFHEGTSTKAYEYLGAQKREEGFDFRVWAPNADYVSVVGDFNAWDPYKNPLNRITDKGIWEGFSKEAKYLDKYKFFIKKGDKTLYKTDPYARYCEKAPLTAGILYDISSYNWSDEGYLDFRKKHYTRERAISEPINIYEVHLGSFLKSHSYLELADSLCTYLKEMGYTHIEIMPITEYPYDASWGYQVTGYYAPTSRYGTPLDFMAFVDKMHKSGIGVILDWVPGHFPKDAHGLYEFDGYLLYEYQGEDRKENKTWGTRRFDVGREEVESFLISSAYYWIEKFHIDALRVDAVASIIYLDYDRKPDEWIKNIYGDNRCLEALAFFKKLNGMLSFDHPDVMTIAEESTAWANVTSFENDGLGFTFKWNMGWMNDTLSYADTDPYFRKYKHSKINFSLSYAFSEKYILPISHDEVVHGKKSFIDKMWGSYNEKFSTARAVLTYMMTHPGKKLNFMGNEIAQFREWDFAGEIEWFLSEFEMHRLYQYFCATLNHLYLSSPPLFECDGDWSGFKWIDADNADESIFTYNRYDLKKNCLTVAINFTPVERRNFFLPLESKGYYCEILNTDDKRFGGEGRLNEGKLLSFSHSYKGYSHAISITLPPLSAVIIKKTEEL